VALFTRFLSLLLSSAVLLGPAAGAVTAQRAAEKRAREPITALERWTNQLRRNGPDVGRDEVQRLEQLVADVRMLQIASPELRRPAVLALLDLAGVRTTEELRTRRTNAFEGSRVGLQTDRLRAFGREALAAILAADTEGKLTDWLALEVLSRPNVQSAERRIAALRMLDGLHRPSTLLPIFACAIDEERDVRDAAMDALVGWQTDAVHRFMLRQLERASENPGWISRRSVRAHFATEAIDPTSPAGRELFAYASQRLLASEWRESFHALQLLAAVQDDPAVPALIEALAVWGARREQGGGSRRIESELLRELERRSGRRIGNHPERWAAWWKVKRSGAIPPESADSARRRTKADFFGLRPVTDRVVFVIDRSGSMTAPFGPHGNTRYGEAIGQMLDFLRELGPKTRFRVVLFSNEPEIWKDRLQPASESNLKAVERWLRYHSPRGGTMLRPAIEEVLRLGWIAGLLERANDDACLAFHCVQIGRGSDGALEALAQGSGGDFVEVVE